MRERILQLVQELVAIKSVSASVNERQVEDYLYGVLEQIPYFVKHGTHFGQIAIPQDPYGRRIVYALVKGHSNKTVVLLNHHDVVGVEPYGSVSDKAFDIEAIKAALLQTELNLEIREELESGEWLAGRGSCDMKGGLAAQLAYLEDYANNPNKGTLLFISVPDEESFSAGMRRGVWFLNEAKKDWDLDYRLAINSEPNRRSEATQIVPVGSVGKVLLVTVVQGCSVYAENYKEGINPLGVLASFIAATEGMDSLTEEYCGERTIPPIWLQARDKKANYDVSVPQRASGYCTLQAFSKTPQEIMRSFKELLVDTIQDFRVQRKLACPIQVIDYSELVQLATATPGYQAWRASKVQDQKKFISEGLGSYLELTIKCIEELLDFVGMNEVVVLGFAPPYYPPANSNAMNKPYFAAICQELAQQKKVKYEQYFLGISDCSYCGLTTPPLDKYYEKNTPLWGELYNFDVAAVARLQIPFMLLGPWGKDLHCKTERVNIKSLTEELPKELALVCSLAWR